MSEAVHIYGAGLAGSEAAWQVVSRGGSVVLHEMRPAITTKAHRSDRCAELVCSNSFRGAALTNAVGLLKEELRRCGSLVMEAADKAAVPAGGALAVDREQFSSYVTTKLRTHPLITYVVEELREIPAVAPHRPVVLASGPLTSPPLANALEQFTGQGNLAFFDAISPILLGSSLDETQLFRQSRYQKGGGDDYLNIPLSREQYYQFVADVLAGEKFGGHDEVEADCVANLRPFEGCMPIEEMASRGPDTLLFGPLKPVGLIDPKTGVRPYAVMQLRQDDKAGTLWSMVGMQTRLKHGEQTRIFRTLPGLAQAEFVRLGSVHRDTFVNSPACLAATAEFRKTPGLFLAGQVSGVEGYVESTASGLVAGVNAWRRTQNKEPLAFPLSTAIGSLLAYISDEQRKDFQPMNISFGLMPGYMSAPRERGTSKDAHRLRVSEKALREIAEFFPGTSN